MTVSYHLTGLFLWRIPFQNTSSLRGARRAGLKLTSDCLPWNSYQWTSHSWASPRRADVQIFGPGLSLALEARPLGWLGYGESVNSYLSQVAQSCFKYLLKKRVRTENINSLREVLLTSSHQCVTMSIRNFRTCFSTQKNTQEYADPKSQGGTL